MLSDPEVKLSPFWIPRTAVWGRGTGTQTGSSEQCSQRLLLRVGGFTKPLEAAGERGDVCLQGGAPKGGGRGKERKEVPEEK